MKAIFKKEFRVYMTSMLGFVFIFFILQVGGQAVLGRQYSFATPWVTERHGYGPAFQRLQ